MDINTLIMALLALLMMLVAYLRHDGTLTTGFKGGILTFIKLLPLLFAVFMIVSYSSLLVPREVIATWLSDQSGWRGIGVATVLGTITPPSVFAVFPIGAALRQAGAGIGPIIAYITAWSLFSIFRLPIELSFVGPQVVLIRLVSTLILPPLAGGIASLLFRS